MSETPRPIDLESISALVPSAKVGNHDARNEICRQVVDYLQMMAEQELDAGLRRKLNPSDVVQQTMTRMINGFEDFRGNSTREFFGWLNQILRNEIHVLRRNHGRAKRDIKREREVASCGDGPNHAPVANDPNLTPSSEAIRRETLETFRKILEKLPKDYALVIQLRSLEELSFKEVAERMDRSSASVTNLWYRAIIRFQEEFALLEEFKGHKP